MEGYITRVPIHGEMAIVQHLANGSVDARALKGDGREIMRHGSGAIHAALVDTSADYPRLTLQGIRSQGGEWEQLVDDIGPEGSLGDTSPATDSNHNGVYIAYVAETESGKSGYVVHVPDPFGDPAKFALHGPLTPDGAVVDDSFFQASRVYNSVVYSWVDRAKGEVFVGVSRDGLSFPEAQPVFNGAVRVTYAATGVRGDYIILAFRTQDERFAPGGRPQEPGSYFGWCDSGDGGKTWTEPRPLFDDPTKLPPAVGYALAKEQDLLRTQVPLSGVTSELGSLQVLVWAPAATLRPDTRVFAMASAVPASANGGEREDAGWYESDNHVGLLAFKPIAVGGDWTYVLTNRSLYRRASRRSPYAGRKASLFKYGALPDTAVRSIAYVEHAPEGTDLEDQVVILVSTNMGDSFDDEAVFSASQLSLDSGARIVLSNSACCFADKEGNIWQDLLVGDEADPKSLRHAMLPIGFNIQGLDPTRSW